MTIETTPAKSSGCAKWILVIVIIAALGCCILAGIGIATGFLGGIVAGLTEFGSSSSVQATLSSLDVQLSTELPSGNEPTVGALQGDIDALAAEMANDSKLSNSLADQTLKRDVLARLMSHYVQGTCKVLIGGVTVTQPMDGNGTWQEEWRMTICGIDHTFIIDFTTDSTGTMFVVSE
jgi:hypothetical protein